MTFTIFCGAKTITFSNSSFKFERTSNGSRLIVNNNKIFEPEMWNWIDVWF